MFLFDSVCGCVELREGTQNFGIIQLILKKVRLIEVLYLTVVSYEAHVVSVIGGGLKFRDEIMFAMPFVSAVAIVLQLVFLTKVVFKMLANQRIDDSKGFTRNLVSFGIECAATVLFWIIMSFSYDRLILQNLFIFVDVLVLASNVYFILLLRSCIAKNYEILPSSTFNRDQEQYLLNDSIEGNC